MAKVANVSVDLVANTTNFEAELRRADAALAKSQTSWSRSLKAVDASFNDLGGSVKGIAGELFSVKGAFTALVGTIGVGSIVAMAKEAVDAVGGLGELASQIGVTTDTLQAFRYAASQVGVSTEDMDKALAKFSRTVGDAANGEKKAVDTLNDLGIGVLDSAGNLRSTDDIIRDAADAIAAIDDPARRASAAFDLFGKSGQKLIPFLQDGSKGIDDLAMQAKALGLVFDDAVIASADEASDKLSTLAQVLTVQMQRALVELAPLLTQMAQSLIDVVEWFNKLDPTAAAQRLRNVEQDIRNFQASLDNMNNGGLFSSFFSEEDKAEVSNRIAELKAEAAELYKQLYPAATGDLARRGLLPEPAVTSGPTSNPPVKSSSSGKSDAEKQAESLQKKIDDLHLEVDTFDLSPVDQQIAKSLQGINMSMPGAKEAVTTISELIRQLNGLESAAAATKAEVAEYDKIVADADAAWQKRVSDGAAITSSVQTPAETYAATVERLTLALDAGTISQETFNRAVAEAQKTLDDATEQENPLRDIADTISDSLAAGIADAVIEAKSFNDALGDILKSLGKIAIQKTLMAIFDKGLNLLFGTSATGGPEGGLTLVGERGPELVDLPAGSYVMPAPRTNGMMQQRVASNNIGSAAGVVVNAPITIEGGGGSQEQNMDLAAKTQAGLQRAVESAVDERIRDNKRSGGILNPGLGWD